MDDMSQLLICAERLEKAAKSFMRARSVGDMLKVSRDALKDAISSLRR
jgi:hypothetical protein